MFINKLLLGGILTCLSIPSFSQIQITPEVGTSIYKEGNSKEKAAISPRIGVELIISLISKRTAGD